jgi:NitT/TauT family transport system permease protein
LKDCALGRESVAVTGPAAERQKRSASTGLFFRSIRGLQLQAISAASVVVGLVLWELAGRFLLPNSLFLATPLQAITAAAELYRTGELQRHVWVSFQEFILGYSIAAVSGILIGLLVTSSKVMSAVTKPWVDGLYATPIIAIAPLVILWFGIGIWSKVFVVFSVVVFPVIINTEAGIRNTDRSLIEAVRSFGATPMQIFMKVSLPSALSFILAGLRLGIGRGLIGVVVGELFGARAGLGYLILQSAEVFNMPRLFAGVLILAVAGIGMTAAFHAFERVLIPWHRA